MTTSTDSIIRVSEDCSTTEATASSTNRVLRGNLEGVVRDQLLGWVVDSNYRGEALLIQVFEGENLVASGAADRERADLNEAGYAEGAYGFELAIDPAVLDGREHLLTLTDAENGEIFAEQVVCVPPHTSIREQILVPQSNEERMESIDLLLTNSIAAEEIAASTIDSVVVDVNYYRYQYVDLQSLSDQQCRDHWRFQGREEGRSPNIKYFIEQEHGVVLPKDFNVPSYISRNPDLIGAFHATWDCIKHYVTEGTVERRAYTPVEVDQRFVRDFYRLSDETKFHDDDKPEDILSVLRELVDNSYDTPLFLNETELIQYAGIQNIKFLEIFDHEAYRSCNGEQVASLSQDSRASCIRHFIQTGMDLSLNISWTHCFDAEFYLNEYVDTLPDELRSPEVDDETIWKIPQVSERLYRHWITKGIGEGREPNLRIMSKTMLGIDLPDFVKHALSVYRHENVELTEIRQPSEVLQHYIYTGLPEMRFGVVLNSLSETFCCDVAEYLTIAGETGKAIKIYERILSFNPEFPIALHHLGDALVRCGFYGRALLCYRTLVDREQAVQWVYLNLAECYKHLGDYSNAAQVMKLGSERFPDDLYLRDKAQEIVRDNVSGTHTRAKQMAMRGDVAGAREEMHRALALLPRSNESYSVTISESMHVAIVGNHDLPQCKFYRIDQKVQHLRSAGYEVSVFKHTEPLDTYYANLSDYAVVIFYRVPSLPDVVDAINAARVLSIPTIYDVDDLIFDEEHFPPPLSTYAGQIGEDVHASLAVDVPLFAHAMAQCDYGLASTSALAEAMQPYVKTGVVRVHRNAFSAVHEHYARLQRVERELPVTTIFYGSGTRAHKDDFHAIVEPAFTRLHQKYGEKIRFLVLGNITMTEDLKSLGESLVLLEPIWDIEQYWCILRDEADINLAVLSSTPVTDAKSEIKWLEAGMLGIPSVVSDTATYRETVDNGVNGILCSDADSFFDGLEYLINDPVARSKIGSAARVTAIQKYSIGVQAANIRNIIEEFKPKITTVKKLRVAVVNVFYPPQSIGGATRVVHDNVTDMMANHSDDVELQVFCSSTGHVAYQTHHYVQDGVRVTAVNIPSVESVDHRLSDSGMGVAFARFLEKMKPDVVHFHCIQRLTESIVTEARRRNIPYLITAHDGWWISDRQFLIGEDDHIDLYDYAKSAIESVCSGSKRQRVLRNEILDARAVLSVSEPFARLYREAGVANVRVVENGVSNIECPQRESSSSGRVRLAHIGGTERHKGLHLLKQALCSMSNTDGLELLVIDHGAVPGSIRKELWGATEVTFRPKLKQARVAELYQEIDVLIAPSVWPESYGLVTREALQCGCWVVASDRGAIGSCITQGENGFVVSIDSIEPLRDILSLLNNNAEKYRSKPSKKPSLRKSVDQASDLLICYQEVAKLATLCVSNVS